MVFVINYSRRWGIEDIKVTASDARQENFMDKLSLKVEDDLLLRKRKPMEGIGRCRTDEYDGNVCRPVDIGISNRILGYCRHG